MAITLNGITGLRVGIRAAVPGQTGRAWIRRANLFVAGDVRVEFKPADSIYTATQDTAKADVPFRGDEAAWWGENISNPGFIYTQAVFNNPNFQADGVVAADMAVETANLAAEYVMDVQISGAWSRIWQHTATGVNNQVQVVKLPQFEPTAAFKFRHQGTELAGTFQGFSRSAAGVDEPFTAMTTPQKDVVIFQPMLNRTIYGTFIPANPELFPKIIGPIKVIE